MKIKIILRYNTPCPSLRKEQQQILIRMMWKEILIYCSRECKLVQSLWKSIWRFLIKTKIELSYNPAILFLGIYPKNYKRKYIGVDCSSILNSQAMESAYLSANRWIDKEIQHCPNLLSVVTINTMTQSNLQKKRFCRLVWNQGKPEQELKVKLR